MHTSLVTNLLEDHTMQAAILFDILFATTFLQPGSRSIFPHVWGWYNEFINPYTPIQKPWGRLKWPYIITKFTAFFFFAWYMLWWICKQRREYDHSRYWIEMSFLRPRVIKQHKAQNLIIFPTSVVSVLLLKNHHYQNIHKTNIPSFQFYFVIHMTGFNTKFYPYSTVKVLRSRQSQYPTQRRCHSRPSLIGRSALHHRPLHCYLLRTVHQWSHSIALRVDDLPEIGQIVLLIHCSSLIVNWLSENMRFTLFLCATHWTNIFEFGRQWFVPYIKHFCVYHLLLPALV